MAESPIQKADAAARRREIFWVIGVLCAGGIALWLVKAFQGPLEETFAHWLLHYPSRIYLAFLLLLSPLVWLARRLYQLGAKVRAAQRFPPPNVPVVRDTKILSGSAALARGRVLQVLGLLLVGFLACLALALYLLIKMLVDGWSSVSHYAVVIDTLLG